MDVDFRKAYFEKKNKEWRDRIAALKLKGDLNGDTAQQLEYLISLLAAKASPDYIPFEIEGIYDETDAVIMYALLLMLRLADSKVPVCVVKICKEKMWIYNSEVEELLNMHGCMKMDSSNGKKYKSFKELSGCQGCAEKTLFSAAEILKYAEPRLLIEAGIGDYADQ